MYKLTQTQINSPRAEALHAMLVGEWSDLPAFEPVVNDVAIPNPVVVLDRETVIGGASFTSYVGPDTHKTEIWLNALFIDPQFRKQGIASRVIKFLHPLPHALYALTDVPNLYTQCGWSILESDGHGTIVKYSKK